MSIMGTIRRFFAPQVYRTYVYGAASAFVDGMSVEELYETQPQLQTVVTYLARNVAQLPLKVYDRASDTDRVRDTTSPLALLLRDPSPEATLYELVYATEIDRLLYDQAFWLISEDSDTESGYAIRRIPVPWVSGDEGGTLFAPDVYVIRNPETGQETRVDSSDLVIFPGYHPTDPRSGSSAVATLKAVLEDQIESYAYRHSMWERSARIPAYISRPLEAAPYDDDDLDRFREAWHDAYSKHGGRTGSTPLLEDGMTIKASPTMNFSDAQWAQSITLSFEYACRAYHIPAGLITGETSYASARDNSRALYADTLGPELRFLAQRINKVLPKRLGMASTAYVEFDIQEKLNGSFLDLAAVLQSSVGAPWLTRNEARAMLNRPAIDGGDDLIVPLNVVEGGLASPRDTTADSYAAMAGEPEVKAADIEISGPKAPSLFDGFATYHAEASNADREEMAAVMRRFFDRQEKSVMAKLGARAKAEGDDWFDAERWDRELSDDLYKVMSDLVDRFGYEAMKALADDPAAWSGRRTDGYVRAVAEAKAHGINASTFRDLLRALEGEVPEGDEKATPRGVFEYAKGFRADVLGASLATTLVNWATTEAVRQSGRQTSELWKRWVVTSGNPRDTHAALNGETVPYDGTFSNGAQWPGDTGALDVDEVAGCQCQLEILIP